jgi:hypothetical protein
MYIFTATFYVLVRFGELLLFSLKYFPSVRCWTSEVRLTFGYLTGIDSFNVNVACHRITFAIVSLDNLYEPFLHHHQFTRTHSPPN